MTATQWYLDTSAALKLIIDEAESAAPAHVVDRDDPALAACWLLETELRRAVPRHPPTGSTTPSTSRAGRHGRFPDGTTCGCVPFGVA